MIFFSGSDKVNVLRLMFLRVATSCGISVKLEVYFHVLYLLPSIVRFMVSRTSVFDRFVDRLLVLHLLLFFYDSHYLQV